MMLINLPIVWQSLWAFNPLYSWHLRVTLHLFIKFLILKWACSHPESSLCDLRCVHNDGNSLLFHLETSVMELIKSSFKLPYTTMSVPQATMTLKQVLCTLIRRHSFTVLGYIAMHGIRTYTKFPKHFVIHSSLAYNKI